MRIRPVFLILLAGGVAVAALLLIVKPGGNEASRSTIPANPSPGSTVKIDSARAGKTKLSRIGTFDQPTYVTAPPGDTNRVFVVEKPGKIRVMSGGKKLSTPFLDITGDTSKDGEQGLLSMAFAPDYASSGLFYINYTNRNGDTRIEEFKRSSDPNKADKSSRRKVLEIAQPFPNHNGGLVLFGPDKLMYIGMGDGGSGGDPDNRAQNLDSLLGKILRIDPRQSDSKPYTSPDSNPYAGRGGRDEIYTTGMRNPWRFAFDRNGGLYIADVGQDSFEEIDYAPSGRAKGVNYGWSCREGKHSYDSSRSCPNAVGPVLEYPHSSGGCSVTGGVVVRDPKLRGMKGRYIYGDFCLGKLRSFKISGGRATGDRGLGITVGNLSSFGEDASGRVYVTSLDGGAPTA